MMKTRQNQSRSLLLLLFAPLLASAQWGPAKVVTENARLENLAPSVEVPGTVISRNDSRLAAELNAKLVWIAEVGTEVKEGDIVARLEDVTFNVQQKEAEALVTSEQARVTFLTSELKRLRQLSEQNLSAASRLDQTVSDLAVAEGDYQIARAQLAYAQIAMHITQIRAPFDGVVTERFRSIGERLNVADEVIRLVDPGALEVVARAPMRSANFVRKGDIITVGNEFRSEQAPIRAMVPFGDPQSHMFEVRLDAAPGLWTVGESVRLTMPTAAAKEVLAVPRDALVLRREGISVFKVNADSTVSQVSVTVGLGAGAMIEVFGPLAAGDEVVVRGAEGLSDGMAVEISGKAMSENQSSEQ